jgi:predicted permease
MQFSVTITSVLTLIAMCIPGFLLIKTKLLKTEAIAVLSTVLLYVNQPAFSFYSFQSQSCTSEVLKNLLLVAGLSALVHLIVLVLSFIIFSRDKNKDRGRAYAFASTFGNIGFMGLPVIRLLMPDNPEVVIYLASMFVIFNLLAWTVGIYIITGDKKYISFKKAVINPPTLAVIIALPLFFLNVTLPDKVLFPIKYLSDMIVPMAMLILGMRFGAIKVGSLFNDWGLYVSSAIKLVLTPLLALGLMKLINLENTVLTTVFILMAMPAANMGLIIAEKFGGDKDASAKAIMGSSIISIITIPLVLLLL